MIKVVMPCDKCRSKAMVLVAATGGVESVAIAGESKDQVVVVSDRVNSVKFTSALRKKVGLIDDVEKNEEQKKQDAPTATTVLEYQFYYHYSALQPVTIIYEYPTTGYAYGYQCRSVSTCSIM
jgi:hypothetical protein